LKFRVERHSRNALEAEDTIRDLDQAIKAVAIADIIDARRDVAAIARDR